MGLKRKAIPTLSQKLKQAKHSSKMTTSTNHDEAPEQAGPSVPLRRNPDGSLKKLPVTILSGFLGSGKTTLLKHILSTPHKLRIALLVNDMAEVNIDGAQVAKLNAKAGKEQIVQMQNGCICCTLRGDFIVELARLARDDRFDYLLIESSGISEPMQVAEGFAVELQNAYLDMGSGFSAEEKEVIEEVAEKGGLEAIARIDTMVTVVDAHNFFREFATGQHLKDRFAKEDVPEKDERTISDLFVDQIEFANVLIINKVDLVDATTLARVRGILKTMNPKAELVEARQARVDVSKLVDTGMFDYEEARLAPGWLKSLQEMIEVDTGGRKRMAPVPETLEYGIGSFVYRARKPFEPSRLYDFFKGKFHLFQTKEQDDEDAAPEAAKAAPDTADPVAEAAPGTSDPSASDAAKEAVNADDEPEEFAWSEHESDSDSDDDETESTGSGPGSTDDVSPPTSVSSGDKANDDDDEEDSEEDLAAIIAAKEADPLLRGIYRIKGFIWLATRPRMTGELSAAGAILTIRGFQEWHAEKVFGACRACPEERDGEPIKKLMTEMLKRRYADPWLRISEEEGMRETVEAALHACHLSPFEIARWFATVASPTLSDEDKEEILETTLLDRYDDLSLDYVGLVCRDFRAPWGDRRQEIVFIGEGVDAAALAADLDHCLLTDEEMARWEAVMRDDAVGGKWGRRVATAEQALATLEQSMLAATLRGEPLDAAATVPERERLQDRLREARAHLAARKEEALCRIWDEEVWAEWVPESQHDHDGEEEGAHAGHGHAGHGH